MALSTDWSVLFLVSPSPGKVFRYLERHQEHLLAVTGAVALPDLLSEPVPPHGWRALTGLNLTAASMEPLAIILSEVFHPRVTLLWKRTDQDRLPSSLMSTWGYVTFEQGKETERATEDTTSPIPRRQPLLTRLPGAKQVTPPEVHWADVRGLPITRVPRATQGREYVPVIDYVTVAQLDQRSLLVENGPRLYRFEFPPPSHPFPPKPGKRETI